MARAKAQWARTRRVEQVADYEHARSWNGLWGFDGEETTRPRVKWSAIIAEEHEIEGLGDYNPMWCAGVDKQKGKETAPVPKPSVIRPIPEIIVTEHGERTF